MKQQSKSAYSIIVDNIILYEGDKVSTGMQHNIELTNHIQLNQNDLRTAIVSHIGKVNNNTILKYFATRNQKDSEISIPTYPLMTIADDFINGIKTLSNGPYYNISVKYKNKPIYDKYINDISANPSTNWDVITEKNGELIIPVMLVVHNNSMYLPKYVSFPFVKINDEYVLKVIETEEGFAIYCTLIFKKDKNLS